MPMEVSWWRRPVQWTATAAGGAIAGASGVALAKDHDLARHVFDSFIQILDKHGLPVAVCCFLITATVFFCWYLLRKLIQSKDAEIARLVQLRDQLWDQFLKERPSSGDRTR